MKLLVEASVLEQDRPSGVNYLASGLVAELEKMQSSDFRLGYFWLNFLRRKSPINSSVRAAATRGDLQQVWAIPQRIYAKLVYYHIAPPLPIQKADWLFYPNFYLWPSIGKHKKAVLIHDLCYLRYPEYVEDKNRAFLSRVATTSIKKADLIVVDSEFIASELVELTNTPRKNIHILGVPVDATDFDPSLDKGPGHLAERYNVIKQYILSFGTLEPRKNLECLVGAYCALAPEIREKYSLVLAGKWGWKIENLRALIEQKQAEGYDIITPGYIDHGDRATFYRNASFYAITTHYEGFGMPLLEALHCGIPTVAVDIPVLREVGGDACLWAEKNTADVSAKLTELISNTDLAHTFTEIGPSQADTYSWKASAQGLLKRLGQ
ncbi:MAG TPA: glycosyltransferase family 1 protein [Candidatus Saccharimonadales bacterium]|nr:glycosyltransferase family 1 protein [Candidatus Saccharimonadales bacterium]